MTDFIQVHEKAFSEDFCNRAIQYFEDMAAAGQVRSRTTEENISRVLKDDTLIFPTIERNIALMASKELILEFNQLFWSKYYAEYLNKFPVLRTADDHNNYNIKIQKTEIGGGYHMWHCESTGRAVSGRILAWTLYLNDVEEGGETEFLYQHQRLKPKAGTFALWPAGFTHTHRGNPPISNAKYIITGWVEF